MGAGRPTSEKPPDVLEKDMKIPMRDGFENRIRVYSPAEASATERPLLVMVHGGGYCIGSLEQEEINCRTWARKFGGVAVSIDHRFVKLHRWVLS